MIHAWKFLQAVGLLMNSLQELSLEELSGLARSIFHTVCTLSCALKHDFTRHMQYIEVGSPLEVNISEVLRKQAALAITGSPEPHLHKVVSRPSNNTQADTPELFNARVLSMRINKLDGDLTNPSESVTGLSSVVSRLHPFHSQLPPAQQKPRIPRKLKQKMEIDRY